MVYLNLLPLRFTVPAILIIMTLIISLYVFENNKQQARIRIEKEMSEQMNQQLFRLQRLVEKELRYNDMSEIQEHFTSLASLPYLDYLIFSDDKEQILASTKLALVGTNIHNLNDIKIEVHDNIREQLEKSLVGIIHLNQDGSKLIGHYPVQIFTDNKQLGLNKIGIISEEYNLTNLKEQAYYSVQQQTLQFSFFLTSLSILMGIFFHFFHTQRINKLVQTSQSFANGNLNNRSQIRGVDELAGLAQAFNVMAEKISNYQTQLIKSEERYSLAAKGANDGLWDWDLIQNKLYYSPRMEEMQGYEAQEVTKQPEEWFNRVHPDDLKELKDKIKLHIEGLTPHFQHEYRLLHKDKTYRWMLCRGLAVRDDHGIAYRMAGSQTDITNRKLAEKQLLKDAFYDALTGLPNRALLIDRLYLSHNKQKRKNNLFAVLYLDIDRFKIINDSLGHSFGDRIIIETAKRLNRFLRPGDTCARIEGDEFVFLIEELGSFENITAIAQRLLNSISGSLNMDEHEVYITVSMGIALNNLAYERPEELIRFANKAMYQAKYMGRNCYEIYEGGMQVNYLALLKLETDLRRALDRNELILYYQPIISLTLGKVVGMEALIRWNHPEQGLVYPNSFITLAEETGLIIPIGKWVLETACLQNKIWQDQGLAQIYVSVNISTIQIQQKDFIALIDSVLKETKLNPNFLELEITETIFLDNFESASQCLNQLKERGIKVSIDDFGVKFSSINYLHQLSIDQLKIDRSFIQKIDLKQETRSITEAIIYMGHGLGITIIAEGVEEKDQVLFLQKHYCQKAQGYYFSPPVNTIEMEEILKKKLYFKEYIENF